MRFLKWWWPARAIALLLFGCQEVPEVEPTLQPIPGKTVQLLDSLQAAAQIQTDEKEGYFEHLSTLDIRLQMDLPPDTAIAKSTLRQRYAPFLARQVRPFTEAERVLLRAAIQQAYTYCAALNARLLPDSVFLAKMSTNVFGPSVYFTRERAIFLPQNELYGNNPALVPVLLHEIFHLISRYQPELRDELYALIGYEPLDDDPYFPGQLLSKRLLNPDGTSHRYAIALTDRTGQARPYLPVITADTTNAYPGKRYFDYIDFRLHPLLPNDGGYAVQPEGVPPKAAPGFFDQIADNTDYIIHPDEILADNFALLVLRQANVRNYANRSLSENGEALLRQMEAVLRQ
jgi:hypothetical protein